MDGIEKIEVSGFGLSQEDVQGIQELMKDMSRTEQVYFKLLSLEKSRLRAMWAMKRMFLDAMGESFDSYEDSDEYAALLTVAIAFVERHCPGVVERHFVIHRSES